MQNHFILIPIADPGSAAEFAQVCSSLFAKSHYAEDLSLSTYAQKWVCFGRRTRKLVTVDWKTSPVYSQYSLGCWGSRERFRVLSVNDMNLPNSLTILRIFFVPLLVVVLLTRQPNWDFWGLPIHFEVLGVLILLAAAATDLMDGYIARKRREITTLGILLDPIADKLLISAAFISLAQMDLVPAWMVVIIIGREFIVTGLREIASVEGLVIPASALGKTKMVLQVLAGCAVILTAKYQALKPLGTTLLWLVVLSAVASAVHYFQMFWSQINVRVRQRRTDVLIVKPDEKPQDVLTR